MGRSRKKSFNQTERKIFASILFIQNFHTKNCEICHNLILLRRDFLPSANFGWLRLFFKDFLELFLPIKTSFRKL